MSGRHGRNPLKDTGIFYCFSTWRPTGGINEYIRLTNMPHHSQLPEDIGDAVQRSAQLHYIVGRGPTHPRLIPIHYGLKTKEQN